MNTIDDNRAPAPSLPPKRAAKPSAPPPAALPAKEPFHTNKGSLFMFSVCAAICGFYTLCTLNKDVTPPDWLRWVEYAQGAAYLLALAVAVVEDCLNKTTNHTLFMIAGLVVLHLALTVLVKSMAALVILVIAMIVLPYAFVAIFGASGVLVAMLGSLFAFGSLAPLMVIGMIIAAFISAFTVSGW